MAEPNTPTGAAAGTPAASSEPTQVPPSMTPPSPPPPPAARIVVTGQKTERELHLESELKTREVRLAELEDENRRLKTVPKTPRPAPEKKSWLSGATFFDEEED